MKLQYLLIPLLLLTVVGATQLSIPSEYTLVRNLTFQTPASGGTGPYTYQWYNKSPTSGNYIIISGAHSLTYYWYTNSNTIPGNWLFIIQSTDSLGAVANSLPLAVWVNTSGGTTVPTQVNQDPLTLPDMFLIFAMLFFIARLILYNSDKREYHWAIVDLLSGLFFFLAFYYYTFPLTATSLTTSVGLSAATNSTTAFVPITSSGFVLLATITIFYIIIMVLFMIADFLHARGMM